MSDERPAPEGPATFRDVFGQAEFRALFTATALSWIGDYVAKAAVAVLVYRETESVALSAAAFAASYLPWLIGVPCSPRSPSGTATGRSWRSAT